MRPIISSYLPPCESLYLSRSDSSFSCFALVLLLLVLALLCLLTLTVQIFRCSFCRFLVFIYSVWLFDAASLIPSLSYFPIFYLVLLTSILSIVLLSRDYWVILLYTFHNIRIHVLLFSWLLNCYIPNFLYCVLFIFLVHYLLLAGCHSSYLSLTFAGVAIVFLQCYFYLIVFTFAWLIISFASISSASPILPQQCFLSGNSSKCTASRPCHRINSPHVAS